MESGTQRADRSRPQDSPQRSGNDRAEGAAIRDGIGDGATRPATRRHASRGDGAARGNDILAALDLGTNNCRLLVARPSGQGGFRVIDAFSRIVRLGEGVGASGALADAAIERTLDALRICGSKIRRRRVTRFRAVATEACRRARNGPEFLARVEQETGIALEVISSSEEAGLALAGCAPLLDPNLPGALVFDIGGGSTELAWSRGTLAQGQAAVTSIPIGVVTLAETYGGDRYGPGVYERMIEDVAVWLRAYEREHAIAAEVGAGRVQVVGTSGTVTTLAGVHLNLPRYVRDRVDGLFLDVADTLAIGRRLADQSFEGRAAHPCIGRERADLVVAGCAILEAICRQWPVMRMRVADRGVREGILFGLIAGTS
ncbi:Ppx/GppA phosphatase family protein [Thalassobaculum salexigens]|uniref:Ppx/GppA phosphatase family protein n=1 Tax=Thalassobaculum salexigens TaxID=455360 RepID=UPI000421974B|nr:Ppx/GppA phosphatase family protein [Thalassobaculum salexigens]